MRFVTEIRFDADIDSIRQMTSLESRQISNFRGVLCGEIGLLLIPRELGCGRSGSRML